MNKVHLSLYELSILAKRAARATGYSWGQAEEAGWMVYQLEYRGLPGLLVMHSLLCGQEAEKNLAAHAPVTDGDLWQSHSGWLSGLDAAIELIDCKLRFVHSPKLELRRVLSPLLLIPAIQYISHILQLHICAQWDQHIIASVRGSLYGNGNNLMPTEPQDIAICCSDQRQMDQSESTLCACAPCPVADELVQKMQLLAHRTYVATDDLSRLRAGDGQA